MADCLRRKKTSQADRVRAANFVWSRFAGLAAILGLFQQPAADYFADLKRRFLESSDLDKEWIEAQIEKRHEARAAKDFLRADEIRAELLAKGADLRDRHDSTDWMVSKEALGQIYGFSAQ